MASLKASRSASVDVSIEPAFQEHIRWVLHNLTGADYDEVVAATGRDPKFLFDSFPLNTRVALLKGKPVALFGLGVDPEGAHPFLLTTADVKGKNLDRFIVEYGRSLVASWSAYHGTLSNVVYTKNHQHIRFIRAMGFTLGDTRKRGPLLLPFTEFSYVPSSTRGSARNARVGR